MIWLLSLGWAEQEPCATSHLLEPGLLRTEVPPRLDTRGVKQERDAYGAFPNQMNSENFVIKWGQTILIHPSVGTKLCLFLIIMYPFIVTA